MLRLPIYNTRWLEAAEHRFDLSGNIFGDADCFFRPRSRPAPCAVTPALCHVEVIGQEPIGTVSNKKTEQFQLRFYFADLQHSDIWISPYSPQRTGPPTMLTVKAQVVQRRLGGVLTAFRTSTCIASCRRPLALPSYVQTRKVAAVPGKPNPDNMGGPGGQEHYPESNPLRRWLHTHRSLFIVQ